MIRRSMFRVLLSLVLLFSQQMAMAHALSHWASQLGGPVAQKTANDSELSSAFAQDRSCAQCLGLSALSSPLASTPRQFLSPEGSAVPAAELKSRSWRLASVRVFDSRGPPVLG